MSIQNKFADNDPYIQTQQTQTANNNSISLNASIAESSQLRASSVVFANQALTRTPGTPYPTLSTVAIDTVGAALAGIGQTGTASQEPGGGGIPCFIGSTWISIPEGEIPIEDIRIGDVVLAFDQNGKRVPKKVTDRFEHLVQEYTNIIFSDGRVTGLIEDHRYWTMRGFEPIRNLDAVWHWADHWKQVAIIDRVKVKEEVIVYNFTVDELHCYVANGDAVSNLKPIEP